MTTTAVEREEAAVEATEAASFDLLTADLREAGENLWPNEARFLVDLYYDIQGHRLRAQSQVRALQESEEPTGVLRGVLDANYTLEKRIAKVLDYWTRSLPLGRWARSQPGIGPVLAAGLLAHIDIEKAQTAGSIWRFAGLDPTMVWGKGEKRPYNATLKTLCWKIGESFTKVSGNEDALYGQLYKQRKVQEVARNERGDFADQAKDKLEKTKIGKGTEAYKHYIEGRLPPARIQLRAQRYAVKLFLAHYHEVAYWLRYGEEPPNPYIFEHGEGEHVHRLSPPNFNPPAEVLA